MSVTPRIAEIEATETEAKGTGSPESTKPPQKRALSRIAGMPAGYFAALAGILVIAAFTGVLPDTMVVGFAVSIVLGGALAWIGGLFPVIRDYGLPTILCTFIPATLMFAGVMPEPVVTVVQNFLGGYGFLDFFVVAVIAGTILGMPRALLLKAGPRFAVPLLGCIVLTLLIIGGIGFFTGFGFVHAILFIAAPVMAGGIGVGALPMSEMYAAQTGGHASDFMGDLMSAVVIGNIVCILVAGIYNGMGRNGKQLFVGFNGNGELLRIKGKKSELTMPPKKDAATFVALGQGVAIAGVLLVAGTLLNAWIPFLHEYAWTIVLAAVIKIVGVLPRELEEASSEWGEMLTSYFVPALLVGVSITYINIDEVLASLRDPMFIILTVLAVVVSGLVAGTLGWLVKFNFVEASITPGLVMADTGGSGDVSVLSAANRMHMMPFAAMTTRLGGAVTLFLTSLMVPLLGAA
jgi:malate:Na+ symporter